MDESTHVDKSESTRCFRLRQGAEISFLSMVRKPGFEAAIEAQHTGDTDKGIVGV
jgi:hypothetical protein